MYYISFIKIIFILNAKFNLLFKAKLVQSKKPSERKAVKKAYEDAIYHRCKVTGT